VYPFLPDLELVNYLLRHSQLHFQTLRFGESFLLFSHCSPRKSALLLMVFLGDLETVRNFDLHRSIPEHGATRLGLHNGPLRDKYDLSFTVPSQCAEQLRTGEADIAIIPAIEYARIPDLEILPELSIASKKMVRSLLLVSKSAHWPIQKRRAGRQFPQHASADEDSLRRALENRSRIHRDAAGPGKPCLKKADAALLIGDPALRLSLTMEPYSTRIEITARRRRPQATIAGWMWNAEKAGVASPAQRLFRFRYGRAIGAL